MKKGLVDIIIPAYNPGSYLVEAIQSCLNQSYKNIKITVVDDCSTQNIEFIKNKFPQVNLLKTPINSGPAGARNFGMENTQGEYISFLDSDDVMSNDKVFFSVKEFESSKVIMMTCGNYQILVNRCKLLPPFYKKAPIINYETLLSRNLVACGSVSIRRSIYEKLGGFDNRFMIGEDYNYWLRLSEEHQIKYINKILYIYSVIPKGNSLTQRTDIQKNHLENLKIIKSESEERMKINELRKTS